jgi:hypothetical protein
MSNLNLPFGYLQRRNNGRLFMKISDCGVACTAGRRIRAPPSAPWWRADVRSGSWLRENVPAREASRIVFSIVLSRQPSPVLFFKSIESRSRDEISVRKFNIGVFHAAKVICRHPPSSVRSLLCISVNRHSRCLPACLKGAISRSDRRHIPAYRARG